MVNSQFRVLNASAQRIERVLMKNAIAIDTVQNCFRVGDRDVMMTKQLT
jgi:hypothetical protein